MLIMTVLFADIAQLGEADKKKHRFFPPNALAARLRGRESN
jgi:hypothetical protein